MFHSGAFYWNLLLVFNISAILAGCSLGTNTFTLLFHVCLTILVSEPWRNQCLVQERRRMMAPESLWLPACPSWGCTFRCCSCFCTSRCWAGDAAWSGAGLKWPQGACLSRAIIATCAPCRMSLTRIKHSQPSVGNVYIKLALVNDRGFKHSFAFAYFALSRSVWYTALFSQEIGQYSKMSMPTLPHM